MSINWIAIVKPSDQHCNHAFELFPPCKKDQRSLSSHSVEAHVQASNKRDNSYAASKELIQVPYAETETVHHFFGRHTDKLRLPCMREKISHPKKKNPTVLLHLHLHLFPPDLLWEYLESTLFHSPVNTACPVPCRVAVLLRSRPQTSLIARSHSHRTSAYPPSPPKVQNRHYHSSLPTYRRRLPATGNRHITVSLYCTVLYHCWCGGLLSFCCVPESHTQRASSRIYLHPENIVSPSTALQLDSHQL